MHSAMISYYDGSAGNLKVAHCSNAECSAATTYTMDGLTATREIRKNAAWKKLPIITLTAKAMPDDQERCIEAGANDYMAKPLDVEKLLSLVRVWMPK